jgi:HD-GYP domain-containing protein (c-di-GMP phosphodiesterase class II)
MSDRDPGISRAEVAAALSLATDLAMGQPLESGLGICVLGLRLAERAGLSDEDRARVHDFALLRHSGCTAENQGFSAIVGDELAFRGGAMTVEATSPRVLFPYMLRYLVRTNGLLGAAGKLAQMASERDRFQEAVLAVCEVAEMLAERMGMPESVQHDLLMGNERWDGRSFLKRAKEDEVPVSVRVVQIAECASVYSALGGPEAASAVVRERAGGAFDPSLATTFAEHAAELCGGEPDSAWDIVIESAPDGGRPLGEEATDAALAAMAEFVDLKSPYTAGHSGAVARLAATAGEHAGLSADEVAQLRRAALVHDLGHVGVPSQIVEKPGKLTADEWERVRLHTYLCERILARSPGLSRLASVGSRHHERCDGSGYHRGLEARNLPVEARLLAAADAFRSMTEPRPYRDALSEDAAAEEVRREAREGRLDSDAVSCVLSAAGRAQKRRRDRVAGLSAREAEVLRLVARGLATKQIAAQLVISPKTADSHIQHIYTKIGVSTRAAATVFAMRHDLVDPIESSGEFPM